MCVMDFIQKQFSKYRMQLTVTWTLMLVVTVYEDTSYLEGAGVAQWYSSRLRTG